MSGSLISRSRFRTYSSELARSVTSFREKRAIIEAHSEDAVKAEVINDIILVPGTVGYGTVGRTLRTPFLDEWDGKRDEARRNGPQLWAEMAERMRRRLRRETLVWAGQTAGGVREIQPVAEIMRQLVDEAEAALARAPRPY